MSRNIRTTSFQTDLDSRGSITDHAAAETTLAHEYAHDMIASFLNVAHTDPDLNVFLQNAPVASWFIQWSITEIQNTFNALWTDEQRTRFIRTLRILHQRLESKVSDHKEMAKDNSISWTEKANHSRIKTAASTLAWLVQNDLIASLEAQNTQNAPVNNPPPINAPVLPNAPTRQFQVWDLEQLQRLLSHHVKWTITHHAFDGFLRNIIGTPQILAQINAIYNQVRTTVRATPRHDTHWNLIPCPLTDNPLIDLWIILWDTSPLPSEKNKLQPLYNSIKTVWQRYERACDINEDDWFYADTVTTNITLTDNNHQPLFAPWGYLHTQPSVQNLIPVLDTSRNMESTYVDDQWHDCKKFIRTTPQGDYQLVGWQVEFDAVAFQREYPDAKSITITRPMLVSWEFTDSGVMIPIVGIKTPFVDKITFAKLSDTVRCNELQTFFGSNNRSELSQELLWKTEEIMNRINRLSGTSYWPDERQTIQQALAAITAERVATVHGVAENTIYNWRGVSFIDRLVTAICAKKATECRTVREFTETVQTLKTDPNQLITALKDIPNDIVTQLMTTIRNVVNAMPRGDVLNAGFVAGLHQSNVATLVSRANTRHPWAPTKNIITRSLDRRIAQPISSMSRRVTLWSQQNDLDADERVQFWDVNELSPYWFLMGIGDGHGEVESKTTDMPWSVWSFTGVVSKVDIQWPNQIDFDVTVPAQRWQPEFVFDGTRADTEAVRDELDTVVLANTLDRKLWLWVKMLLESSLLHRLEAQNGDISASFDGGRVLTIRHDASGQVELCESCGWVNTVYTQKSISTDAEAWEFVSTIRLVMDTHVQWAFALLTNWATNPRDVILDFPTLDSLEHADGKRNEWLDLSFTREKEFWWTKIEIAYTWDEDGNYSLTIFDGVKKESFKSVGEIVMSARYWAVALDIMHWFHEQLIEELMLNRKSLPRDRTFVVQDPISWNRYGFYHNGLRMVYGRIHSITWQPTLWMTMWQQINDVDPDPKWRCVMVQWQVAFEKWSNDAAKKTICWRKDIFYPLIQTALATSTAWKNERERIAAEKAKSAQETSEFFGELKKPENRWTLRTIGKEAFKKFS